MKYRTEEEIASLSDDRLFDILGCVFEEGFEAEQDPDFKGTPEHVKMLDYHSRLFSESNKRTRRNVLPATDAAPPPAGDAPILDSTKSLDE